MNVSIVIHHFRQILGSVLAMSTTELNGFFLSDAILIINCTKIQGWIFWPMPSGKEHCLFWLIPTLLIKSLSNQKVQENKLALKSEMKGSFLCELFDLTNFLLIK